MIFMFANAGSTSGFGELGLFRVHFGLGVGKYGFLPAFSILKIPCGSRIGNA